MFFLYISSSFPVVFFSFPSFTDCFFSFSPRRGGVYDA